MSSNRPDRTNKGPLPESERLDYLDAARGLAALMVLFYHFFQWRWSEATEVHLLSIIFNGSDAVSFFFVLSGMVLSYKYLDKGYPLDMGKFYVNRVFRLWPAYAFTVFVCALFAHRHGLNTTILKDVFIKNNYQFYEELLLPWARDHKYFGAGWTLTIELGLSLFTPFAIVIAKHNKRLLWWLLLCVVVSNPIISGFHFHFISGVIVSAYYYDIKSDWFKSTWAYKFRYIILPFAMVLFSLRHIERLSPFGPTYKYLTEYLRLDVFMLTGLASFIFLVYLVRSKTVQRVLELPLFKFYGRISYGIYLMHWIVVAYTFDNWDFIREHLTGSLQAIVVMLLACLAVTTLMAVLVYECVEFPFIKMGRRITAKMRATAKA